MAETKPDCICALEDLLDPTVLPQGWVLIKRDVDGAGGFGLKYTSDTDPLADLAALQERLDAAERNAEWKRAFDEGEVCGMKSNTTDADNPYQEASHAYCGWSFGFWHSRDRSLLKVAEQALRQIAKGEGRFSRDPLTHASNTIEDMKALAVAALAGPQEESSHGGVRSAKTVLTPHDIVEEYLAERDAAQFSINAGIPAEKWEREFQRTYDALNASIAERGEWQLAVRGLRLHYPEDIFPPDSTSIDSRSAKFARSLMDILLNPDRRKELAASAQEESHG